MSVITQWHPVVAKLLDIYIDPVLWDVSGTVTATKLLSVVACWATAADSAHRWLSCCRCCRICWSVILQHCRTLQALKLVLSLHNKSSAIYDKVSALSLSYKKWADNWIQPLTVLDCSIERVISVGPQSVSSTLCLIIIIVTKTQQGLKFPYCFVMNSSNSC